MSVNKKTITTLLMFCFPILAEAAPYDSGPAWSQDGKYIYFYSYRHNRQAELYRMLPDGTAQERLTHTDYNEWWSWTLPDESKLIIASDKDSAGRFKGSNLYYLDLPSGNMERITDAKPTEWATRASITQDGKLLIYSLSESLNPEDKNELYVLNLLTGEKHLYNDDLAHNNIFPAINARGTSVAYFRRVNGKTYLYLNNIEGSSEQELVRIDGEAYAAQFSPDGEWLAFNAGSQTISTLDPNSTYVEREIFIIKTDGTNLKRLTFNPQSDHGPSWSPDGSIITFSSYRNGPADIFSITAEGKDEKNLTNTSLNTDR